MQLFLNLSCFLSLGFQISFPRMRWATPYKPRNTSVTAKVMVLVKKVMSMFLSCLSEQDAPQASAISALTNMLEAASRFTKASSPSLSQVQLHSANADTKTDVHAPRLNPLRIWLFNHLCPVSKLPTQQSGHYKSWGKEKQNRKPLSSIIWHLSIWSWLYSHFSATA